MGPLSPQFGDAYQKAADDNEREALALLLRIGSKYDMIEERTGVTASRLKELVGEAPQPPRSAAISAELPRDWVPVKIVGAVDTYMIFVDETNSGLYRPLLKKGRHLYWTLADITGHALPYVQSLREAFERKRNQL